MTATNHALTGAVIGLIVGDPFIALPAAFLSHFVCDVIPHYGAGGYEHDDESQITTKTFKRNLAIDAILCVVIVIILASVHPRHWLLASVCAFLATSPDLAWINRFMLAQKGKKWKPNLFTKFAHNIQWFQRPIGAVVELVWAASAITVLSILI